VPGEKERHGAQTPHESGLPRMSSSEPRDKGRECSVQFERSVDEWIWIPGYHSKVEVAM